MLHENEVAPFIKASFPEMNITGAIIGNENKAAYNAISALSEFMKQKSGEHDEDSVKKAMKVAETIHMRGDARIKSGIENIFISSISAVMPYFSKSRQELQAIIPAHLLSIYKQQKLNSDL